MLRNLLRRAASGRLIAGTPNAGFVASQIIAETATGDSGPGLLYDEALAQTGRQLRVKITSWSGTPGTLFVFENGSALIEGQADGAFSIGYDWEAWASDGNLVSGSDTASVTVGSASSTAPGASVTGSGTVISGAASGEQNAIATGAAATGSGTVTGGDASGSSSGEATAPGATMTGPGAVVGGSAAGGFSRAPSGHGPAIIRPSGTRPANTASRRY